MKIGGLVIPAAVMMCCQASFVAHVLLFGSVLAVATLIGDIGTQDQEAKPLFSLSIPIAFPVIGLDGVSSSTIVPTPLAIFANDDLYNQVNVFCLQNMMDYVHCRLLEDMMVKKMNVYLEELNRNQQQQLVHLPNSLRDEINEFLEHEESSQDCDLTTETCRFKHLYYDSVQERFFFNICNPFHADTDVVTAAARKFSLQARSSYVGMNFTENFNFSTFCIYDLDLEDETAPSVHQVYPGKTVFLARRKAAHHAGHLCLETSIPLEKLANFYGVEDVESRVILFDDDCFDRMILCCDGDSIEQRQACYQFTDSYISPLSSSPIQTYKDLLLLSKNTSSRFLSFADVVVGIGRFSPFELLASCGYSCPNTWLKEPSIESYREKVYQHVGAVVTNVIKTNTNGTHYKNRPLLTYIYKVGRRTVLNYMEIFNFLEVWCVQHLFELKLMNLLETSHFNKIQTLANTDILIANGGSNFQMSLFLRPYASAIQFEMIDLIEETGKLKVFTFENEQIFEHVPFFTFHRYTDYCGGVDTITDFIRDSVRNVSMYTMTMGVSYNVSLVVFERMLEDVVKQRGVIQNTGW